MSLEEKKEKGMNGKEGRRGGGQKKEHKSENLGTIYFHTKTFTYYFQIVFNQ